MRKRGCCRPLSVRLSVTLVHCIHMAEDIVKLLVRPSSYIILVFDLQCRYPIPLQRGHKIHVGWEKLRFLTEIAVYIFRRPCSDFTDMLWRLTNCSIITIIS